MKHGTASRLSRRLLSLLLSVILLCSAVTLLSCGSEQNKEPGDKGDSDKDEKSDVTPTDTSDGKPSSTAADGDFVRITVENYGDIIIKLDPEAAPITVANFKKLVSEGFYDGIIFHRIVPGFVIQGGDPEGTGFGGSSEKIKGEFAANGVENPISHSRGVISMARAQDPNSASSQFFIVLSNSAKASLDGLYAAFGKVVEGMDVVDAIAAVDRNGERPVTPVVIKSAVLLETVAEF